MDQFFMTCFECTNLYYQYCFNFFPILYQSGQYDPIQTDKSYMDKTKLIYYSMDQECLDILSDYIESFNVDDENIRFNYSSIFSYMFDYNGIKWIKKIKKSAENGYV